MRQFRTDNTEGYSAADLAALNTAWESCSSFLASYRRDDAARKSWVDYMSAQILANYDAGLRGEDLTTTRSDDALIPIAVTGALLGGGS